MNMPSRQPLPRAPAPADDWTYEDYAQYALDAAREVVPYVPVVGPASDMVSDLREGDYASAAFNGAMLAADLSPIGPATKVLKLIRAIKKTAKVPLLASAATQRARIRRIAEVPPGYAVHHTIPMKGLGPIPKADSRARGLWRNNPAFFKILPEATHRRVHGNFGAEPYDPLRRIWHGTNALQKSAAAFATSRVADTAENLHRTSPEDRTRKR